ncbi:MAG TPA: RDD family protein [Herbaspirillum sp.]|jgi:uncharacterized RDD family membrane protein YckC|nr:RDD family protein [Herbaspirillum sp.]
MSDINVDGFSNAPLKRRLFSMLYEAMLLFGVLFISAWIFSTLLQQRSAIYLRHGLELWLFVVLTCYFVWFWCHGGQTLAMKTWRLRLVTRDGGPIRPWRALARFLLAWLWFMPGLVIAWLVHAQAWLLVVIPALNFLLWMLMIYIDPQRQFLHDRLAGTRIISLN